MRKKKVMRNPGPGFTAKILVKMPKELLMEMWAAVYIANWEVGRLGKIYADFNATCPCSPGHIEKLSVMMPALAGNPSSIHHWGRKAKFQLDEAKGYVAELFGCRHAQRNRLTMTSSATEANNLALQGVVRQYHRRSRQMREALKPSIVRTQAEHSSLVRPAKMLSNEGFIEERVASIDHCGKVDYNSLLRLVDETTIFVAFTYINGEVGAKNSAQELVKGLRESGYLGHIHIDGTQALGKVDARWVSQSGVSSMSGSAHKIGGLKGVGCLYLGSGVSMDPMVLGGAQEGQLRSGTENLLGIFSFGQVAKDVVGSNDWLEKTKPAYERLRLGLENINGVEIHGCECSRVPSTLNFHLRGVPRERVLFEADLAGIGISGGSACASGSSEPSVMLISMGYSEWVARNSIRVSFGPTSCVDHANGILTVIERLARSVD